MEHYKEEYGDAVEHNRVMHEEALRRAHARNVEDMNTYSPEETAPALPHVHGQLNWGGGEHVITPSLNVERLPESESTPEVSHHGLYGVDEIARR